MTDQANPNNIYAEVGTPGLEAWAGVITKAYTSELRWPHCYPIYSRIRRSDPEMSIARVVFSIFARQTKFEFVPDEKGGDPEKKFAEFGNQVLDDFEGGQSLLLETIAEYVPFFGWGWWEALPGVRTPGWRAPEDDGWQSSYDDGLIGLRRLAFRDPSSFWMWDLNPRGRLTGMWQLDTPYPQVLLPLSRSLHLTFGDANSPEGLSPLESIYRLERVKYALELIQGIGYEHAAGYLEVRSAKELTPADKTLIRQMARSVLTAQEANYAAWPSHLTGEIKDIPFQAGVSLLEAIRYYSILKLQLFLMQWVAMASTAGTGAYSAMQDTSMMFLNFFNAMTGSFADQADAQIGRRLLEWNPDQFPGMKTRPRIRASKIEKPALLNDLVALITGMMGELGPEDWTAIRKSSSLLSDKLKENQEGYNPQPVAPKEEPETPPEENMEEPAPETQVETAMTRWRGWAKENDPDTWQLINQEAK